MQYHRQPQLIVIAGPNGAGKSTFSKDYLAPGAILYDPDKESKRISQQYAGLPAASIHFFINHHFLDLISHAWQNRLDFVLETNFRDHQLMDTVEQFREKGYGINLVYFLLTGIPAAIDRVTTRVNNGGHFVDQQSVRLNYTEGLANLYYFSPRFDKVDVLNAADKFGKLTPLLNIQDNAITKLNPDIPKWATTIINNIATPYAPNPERKPWEHDDDDGQQDQHTGPGR